MKRITINLLLVFLVTASAHVPAISLSMKSVLGSESLTDSSFKRVTEAKTFYFPEDHLAHPDYQTEWWYFTGNLYDIDKASQTPDFAYQFTLFRFALQKDKHKDSNWRSQQIYMAHLALTDLQTRQQFQQERFSRDALGLAGVQKNEQGFLQFWLNDWQLQSLQPEQLFPLQLELKTEDFQLALILSSHKPLVLQGDRGFSQKSEKMGNASYYYSYTRLLTEGKIRFNGRPYKVSGSSWMDREWSTSSLGSEQQGWDWFSLQLDDGSELMLYQMRKNDGSKDKFSSATLIDRQGNYTVIKAEQFQLQRLESWRSPDSNIVYPVKWQIDIPVQALTLVVSTPVKKQEWSKTTGASFNYWEGAVRVKGRKAGQEVSGSGFLEMTGYQ